MSQLPSPSGRADLSSPERVEAQLRAEAAALRRPAPDRLRAAVMARIHGGAAPRALPRVRRTVLALGGLAAAALVLVPVLVPVLLRDPAPSPAPAEPGSDGLESIRRIAGLFEASRATALDGIELERPLLDELEALGQDTARAAATLARGLPGPVGRLFSAPPASR
jgi:hypothetical protein